MGLFHEQQLLGFICYTRASMAYLLRMSYQCFISFKRVTMVFTSSRATNVLSHSQEPPCLYLLHKSQHDFISYTRATVALYLLLNYKGFISKAYNGFVSLTRGSVALSLLQATPMFYLLHKSQNGFIPYPWYHGFTSSQGLAWLYLLQKTYHPFRLYFLQTLSFFKRSNASSSHTQSNMPLSSTQENSTCLYLLHKGQDALPPTKDALSHNFSW